MLTGENMLLSANICCLVVEVCPPTTSAGQNNNFMCQNTHTLLILISVGLGWHTPIFAENDFFLFVHFGPLFLPSINSAVLPMALMCVCVFKPNFWALFGPIFLTFRIK